MRKKNNREVQSQRQPSTPGFSAASDHTRAPQALKHNRITPSLPRIEVNGCRLLIDKAKTYGLQSPRPPSAHLAADGDEYCEVDGEPSLREATHNQNLRQSAKENDAQRLLPTKNTPVKCHGDNYIARAALPLVLSHLPANTHPSVSIIFLCGFVNTSKNSENVEDRVKSPAEIKYEELPFMRKHYFLTYALRLLEAIYPLCGHVTSAKWRRCNLIGSPSSDDGRRAYEDWLVEDGVQVK